MARREIESADEFASNYDGMGRVHWVRLDGECYYEEDDHGFITVSGRSPRWSAGGQRIKTFECFYDPDDGPDRMEITRPLDAYDPSQNTLVLGLRKTSGLPVLMAVELDKLNPSSEQTS